MNLFQLKSNPYGVEQIEDFLENNFVSIELRGIGSLENVDTDQIRKRLLEQTYLYKDEDHTTQLEEVNLFVHTMQDGDYVLVADQDIVHLGDLGDYFYDELSDTLEKGMCHRRGVTWLTRIPRSELNTDVQELLAQPDRVSRFKYPTSRAQLDTWGSNLLLSEKSNSNAASVQVDGKTIEAALEILKKALLSDDVERQERAAIAILQYAK